MKTLIISLLIFLSFEAVSLFAQENSQDTLSASSKIDSIYALQKKMYKETRHEPLTGKNYGVEFNFFRLLAIEKSVSLSGGFSLFNANRKKH